MASHAQACLPLHPRRKKGREDCAARAIILANGGEIEVKARLESSSTTGSHQPAERSKDREHEWKRQAKSPERQIGQGSSGKRRQIRKGATQDNRGRRH